jgi:multidrug efflux system membrane fusion protein
MKKKVVVPALLAVLFAAGGLLYFTHVRPLEKVDAAPAPPAVPIVAGTVAQHDVPIYLTGVGTVIAYNTDVVRAQIQGQIISINFTEGQTVHAGDLLAQIDPRPYQALIEQYTGNATPIWGTRVGQHHNWSRHSKRKSASCKRLSRPTRR